MKCPICGTWTEVLETRNNKNNTTRRRYECANLHRFTTTETVTRQEKTNDFPISKARTNQATPAQH